MEQINLLPVLALLVGYFAGVVTAALFVAARTVHIRENRDDA